MQLVLRQLGSTALFAGRFREAAGRALLLPRRRADQRSPLWQLRKRSYDLLSVASRYPQFPLLLEAYRECLRDVFDMPALIETLRAIEQRQLRVHVVETRKPSPFAVFAAVQLRGQFHVRRRCAAGRAPRAGPDHRSGSVARAAGRGRSARVARCGRDCGGGRGGAMPRGELSRALGRRHPRSVPAARRSFARGTGPARGFRRICWRMSTG